MLPTLGSPSGQLDGLGASFLCRLAAGSTAGLQCPRQAGQTQTCLQPGLLGLKDACPKCPDSGGHRTFAWPRPGRPGDRCLASCSPGPSLPGGQSCILSPLAWPSSGQESPGGAGPGGSKTTSDSARCRMQPHCTHHPVRGRNPPGLHPDPGRAGGREDRGGVASRARGVATTSGRGQQTSQGRRGGAEPRWAGLPGR